MKLKQALRIRCVSFNWPRAKKNFCAWVTNYIHCKFLSLEMPTFVLMSKVSPGLNINVIFLISVPL